MDRKPVRKIGMGHGSLRSSFPSEKVGRMISLESSLERDCCILLEFDNLVTIFTEQPLKIPYSINNKEHIYTPDFLSEHHGGEKPTQLIEVKYMDDLHKNESLYQPKFDAAKLTAQKQGWEFIILTEREIRTPYLENAAFLIKYRNKGRQENTFYLLQLINDLGKTTPDNLLMAAFQDRDRRAEIMPNLWYMLYHSLIGCDLRQKLGMQSAIWPLTI